jgi:hypothetical protein
MEDLTKWFPNCHSEQRKNDHSRSKNLERCLTKYVDNLQTRPNKHHSFRDSMTSLSKRYGLVILRQNSF